MVNVKYDLSHWSFFFALWMLGGSFACFSAGLVFWIGQTYANSGAFLAFTLVGAAFLLLGFITLTMNSKKAMADESVKTSDAANTTIVSLMVLTLILDVVLIIVANVA